MKLGVWLLSMCEPLLAKVLLSLGFSVVSIVGVEAAINGLKAEIVTSLMGMPSVWLEFALFLWFGKALGIIFGAMTTKLLLWSIGNATSLLGRAP